MLREEFLFEAAIILVLLIIVGGPLLVMISVSVAYFRNGTDYYGRFVRYLASAHGVTAAGINIASWVCVFASYEVPRRLYALHLIPIGLIFMSFVLFSGKKGIHFLQIKNVLAMSWSSFFGLLALSGFFAG